MLYWSSLIVHLHQFHVLTYTDILESYLPASDGMLWLYILQILSYWLSAFIHGNLDAGTLELCNQVLYYNLRLSSQPYISEFAKTISTSPEEDFCIECIGTLSNLTLPNIDYKLLLQENKLIPFIEGVLACKPALPIFQYWHAYHIYVDGTWVDCVWLSWLCQSLKTLMPMVTMV